MFLVSERLVAGFDVKSHSLTLRVILGIVCWLELFVTSSTQLPNVYIIHSGSKQLGVRHELYSASSIQAFVSKETH